MAYVVEEDLAIAAVPVGFHELGIAAIRSLSDTRELFIVVEEVGKGMTTGGKWRVFCLDFSRSSTQDLRNSSITKC